MDNTGQKKIFSRNLKRWMFLKDKTQIDLMNELKLPSATISSWCNGKKYPRIDKMQMLADYFGILKSDLMEDKEEIKENPSNANDQLNNLIQQVNNNELVSATGDKLVLTEAEKEMLINAFKLGHSIVKNAKIE